MSVVEVLVEVVVRQSCSLQPPLYTCFAECQAEDMMTRIPGIRKHMCKICGQSAKLKHHLKRHILSKHTSTRFPCHFCKDKNWAQEHDRHKHYRRHHGLELSMKQIRDLIEEANQQNRNS